MNSGLDGAGHLIDLELTADPQPRCPECSQPGLLSALVPHSTTNSRGEEWHGHTVAVLCQGCDIADPAAGSLIAFLTVHKEITDETMVQAAVLIAGWANSAKSKHFDPAKLHEQFEAWQREQL